MFKGTVEKTLSKNALVKRINRQLVANFFTVEEFKDLSEKNAIKVIKLISKIEGVKLSKIEIRDIVTFIKSDFEISPAKNTSISKLWNFVSNYSRVLWEKTNKFSLKIKLINIIRYFRFEKFDLLRI